MITETGRVVAIEDDCLWVETIQRSACQSCSAEKGCGQKLVSRWGSNASYLRVLLEGRNPASYHLDERVTLGIPERVVANGSLLVYLLPLVIMMAGVALGSYWSLTDGFIMLLALVGLLLGAGIIRLHSHLNRNNPDLQPVLVDDGLSVGLHDESGCSVVTNVLMP